MATMQQQKTGNRLLYRGKPYPKTWWDIKTKRGSGAGPTHNKGDQLEGDK